MWCMVDWYGQQFVVMQCVGMNVVPVSGVATCSEAEGVGRGVEGNIYEERTGLFDRKTKVRPIDETNKNQPMKMSNAARSHYRTAYTYHPGYELLASTPGGNRSRNRDTPWWEVSPLTLYRPCGQARTRVQWLAIDLSPLYSLIM